MSIERLHAGPRMSKIAIVGSTVYFSGLTALETSGTGVAEQTADILAQIDALLAEAGSSREHVYKASIWLSDIATFDEMNGVWDRWVTPGSAPVRATVESRLARPEILVEIQVEAVRALAH